MGSLFGKPSSKKNAKSDSANVQNSAPVTQQQPYEIDDPNRYDDEAVASLKKEFDDDPETFILNQILMSIMFFDDYQEEIGILANNVFDRGQKMNSELIQQHQKQLLMPDVVMESVNKRVKYQYSRGPKKEKMEPLVSQRMFILHDTIEIEDKRDSVDYSRIDKPCYRAEVEESKENKGFVKVNLLGTAGTNLSRMEDQKRESADSACSTTSTRCEIPLSTRNGSNESPSSSGNQNIDSGFSTESDYEYTRITAAKTPRKLQISEKDIYTNISQLPSKCITPVPIKNEYESDSDSGDEEKDRMRKRKFKQPDLFLTHYYLNSVEFMLHFKDNVFPNYLGEVLDFSEEAIKQATSIPGAIYCDSTDYWDNYLQYEVLPAIGIPWPDEIAFEWSLRRRVTVWDRREEKVIAYKWPTVKMIEEAKKLNCVLIPRGFMPKKGDNPKMHIEWEVCFPKAERYLEFRMTHAQTRILLYILTLYKTFIEPKTQKQGLLAEHIRILMFWECEANYKAWPEDKLGIKLKLMLKTLYEHLSKRQMSHYFIRGKNVLENIPGRYIISTLETINLILESPVAYILFALKHLKYTHGRFYPELNCDELYDILTSETALSPELNLTILAQEQAKMKEEARRRNEANGKKNKRDKDREWTRRYLEQQRHANTRKLMSNNTDQTQNLKKERKESCTSLNFEIPLKKQFANNFSRQISLFTFFIEHFLQIAKKSSKISSTNQTSFYLKQAWYLTKLLEGIDEEKAIDFQNQIKKEEENCQKRTVVEPKTPSTPKRNSSLFMYQTNEVLKVKGKEVNIKNLSKSYNANALANEPKPSTSGMKKKVKRQNQLEPKTNILEKQPRVVTHDQNNIQNNSTADDVQLRQSTEPIQMRKAVSFRTSNHIDITGNVGSESTSL